MNTLIEFCITNAGPLALLAVIWLFTIGVTIMLAERSGYREGVEDGYDAGAKDAVMEFRKREREARAAR